ncbi:MAG: polyphosphate:AMP phosphotransferase [Roseibium sp.]|uniref:polyphosphate:AMP phosphotransferase n=1 Tax=Roseibium sp. TaxID=1936156 RepID=UPI001B01DA9F|nr:polyphosphate:AMP phosphotransferase [Roseibium sp.]MBO6891906.1 polyphosphate:AMP phosphotransferase [Roseibium sp.]MBO6929227.1 polyphosphate:AMP phosphotransferase [Roseibium sp.]
MFESAQLPQKMDKKTFKQLEPELREALLAAQLPVIENKPFSTLILVDGLDGAGKGEAVARLYGWMDARHLVCNAYGEPMDEARLRPPLWRYWRDLPEKGETAIVFGSWYQSILRDRIYEKIDDDAFEKSLARIRRFEEMLSNEDVLILKFWFVLPRDVQEERLKKIKKKNAARHVLADWAALKNHKIASEMGEKLILETSKGYAPWFVIPSQDPEYRDAALAQTVARSMKLKLEDGEAHSISAPPVVGGLKKETAVDTIDLTAKLAKADYEEMRDKYQKKLSDLSDRKSMSKTGVVLVFQGNDAAGKGGAIRRVIRPLDPRIYKVHPISAPTDEEKARPYLWRFWRRLPRKGHFAIFDRSWYERVLVERVEGYAGHEDWLRAYNEINEFEQELTDFGYIVCKFWLAISEEEQLRRFKAREDTAYKQHKITDDDWRNRLKWDQYAIAAGDMVDRTSTHYAPWTLVSAENKRHARVEVLRTICERLEEML